MSPIIPTTKYSYTFVINSIATGLHESKLCVHKSHIDSWPKYDNGNNWWS